MHPSIRETQNVTLANSQLLVASQDIRKSSWSQANSTDGFLLRYSYTVLLNDSWVKRKSNYLKVLALRTQPASIASLLE